MSEIVLRILLAEIAVYERGGDLVRRRAGLDQRRPHLFHSCVRRARLNRAQTKLLLNLSGRRSLPLGRLDGFGPEVEPSQVTKTGRPHQVRPAVARIEPVGPRQPLLRSTDRTRLHLTRGHLPSQPCQNSAAERKHHDNSHDEERATDENHATSPGSRPSGL